MSERTQKIRLHSLSFWTGALILTVLVLLFATLPAGAKENAEILLSPGLSVIAERCELVVSVIPGGEAVFTREDFERTVGYKLDEITLTECPSSAIGQLTMGNIVLPEGQRLKASNLGRISFMPSASTDAKSASFRFRADDAAHEYVCIVRLTDAGKDNAAPSLDSATAAALNLKAPLGGECGGVLAAYDPDGDKKIFEISGYPRHGCVILTDRELGSYIYKPAEGYTGRDEFSYVVRDEWGNYSEEAVVRVYVSRFSEDEFADTSGTLGTDARLVSAAGLMGGTTIGKEKYFYPDRSVTRSEFLVMLMIAAGYDCASDETKLTVFDDDAEISVSARPYVCAAYEAGIVSGWIIDGEHLFLPDSEITLAEAAVMTSRLLGLDTDIAAEVSAGAANWAREEIAVLCFAGFPIKNDLMSVSASKLLSRGEAAGILRGVLAIAETGGIPE